MIVRGYYTFIMVSLVHFKDTVVQNARPTLTETINSLLQSNHSLRTPLPIFKPRIYSVAVEANISEEEKIRKR